jgi:hypothetical protein
MNEQAPSKRLVDRLRGWYHNDDISTGDTVLLMGEAAGEIERLQRELDRMFSLAGNVLPQLHDAVARAAHEPPADCAQCSNVAPIANVIVSNGEFAGITMYAPGLPDGEHDLYPSASTPPPGDDAARLNWWFMNVLYVGGDEDDDESGSEIEYEARLCRTPDEFRKLVDAEMGPVLTKGENHG